MDGAILRSRRRDIDVSLHNLIQSQLPARTRSDYHEHLDLNSRLVRLSDSAQALDVMSGSQRAYERYYEAISNDLAVYSQSDESKCIIAGIDLDTIRAFRSHNASSYHKLVPECFAFRPWPAKIPTAPFAYPIIVRPPLNCEDIYDRLLKIGVLPSRLIDKWDHIPKGDDRFGIEHTFMDQHLLLPVGEEVTHDNIVKIGKCLKEAASAS